MERLGFRLQLRGDMLDEYLKHHESVQQRSQTPQAM
ncbi:MAG: hypothetical protein RI917_14 [Actinomycetota bacterium]